MIKKKAIQFNFDNMKYFKYLQIYVLIKFK